MDHQKIYNKLINLAKLKNRKRFPKTNIEYVYYEKHHIIPRGIGGTDDKENLVLLTAREHFICHKLLTYIYPNNIRIINAFFLMAFDKRINRKVSSRDYAYARELRALTPMSKEQRENIGKAGLGRKCSEETKQKIRESAKGRIISEEQKEQIRKTLTGRKQSSETIEKRSIKLKKVVHWWNIGKSPANKGIPCSEETKRKISESSKGQKRPKDKEYRNKISEGLKRYHQNKNNE